MLGGCWQDLGIPNWFVLSAVTLTCFHVKLQNPLAWVQMILATASPTNRTVPKIPQFPRLVPKPGQGCFSRRMFSWGLLPSCSHVSLQELGLGPAHPKHRCLGCAGGMDAASSQSPSRGSVRASQAYLLLSGSSGCRTDILFTHHVSFLLLQAVLKDQSQMRQMELEIRPVFLVPDTNGFIDHLGSLVTLLDCRKFILVVPLIGE